MAERYDEQYRGDRGQRGDRGFVERAGDEVRSWFGDDEAERRRQSDDRDRDREGYRNRQWGQSSDYGRGQDYRGQDFRGQDYRGQEYRGGQEYRRQEYRGQGYPGQDYRSQDDRGQRYGGDDYGRWRSSGEGGFRGVSEYGSRYGADYDTGQSGSNYGSGAGYGYSSGGSYGAGYSSYGPGSSPGFQGYAQGTGRGAAYQGERDYGAFGRPGWESEGISERGRFAGRGPKGYQRSDSRISEDVCDRLAESPDVDASNIEVKVENGEVTLTGSVVERGEKRRAEDLIEHISGVREVHNHLRVNRGQGGQDEGVGRTSVLGLNAGANAGATGGAVSTDRPANTTAGTRGTGVGSSGASNTGDIANPGITGGGPSGATDVSGTSGASGAGSTLGLNDRPEKTSTAGGRR